MKQLFSVLSLFLTISATAQLNLIPQPVKTTIGTGKFQISKNTVLLVSDEMEKNSAAFFNNYLQQYYGFTLPVKSEAKSNFIRLTTRRFIQAPDNEGRYTLTVKPGSAVIEGDSYQATFYGIQSLIQLLPLQKSATLPVTAVTIEDYPRFNYRGLHLDVSRHFFPVDYVKRYIDYIALHKMNYFHWHLTDDQGWRIEIKKYPKLTELGGFRDGTIIGRYPGTGNDSLRYGGFYTQEEVKEVVEYASRRFITVIPEIEMPGHAVAALTAYPHLGCTGGPYQVKQTWGVFEEVFCAGNDSVFSFLQDVMDEVIPLFPAKYVHVGGDECPKDSWKKCPKCQERIKDNNLKDEHELQSYFIQRMEKYINSKGKTIIGWDEILEGGLAPNAVVMSWRGEQGGIEAAKQKHYVIMTPGSHVYFDHTQSKVDDSVTFGGYTPLEKTYSYEPVPKELNEEDAKFVLGAQANLWTEYIKNTRKIEYQIFPRLSALSEVLWTPKEKKNWADFERRLPMQFKRYEFWGANYSRAYYDLKPAIAPSKDGNGVLWKLEGDSKKGVIRYKTSRENSKLNVYSKPILVTKDSEFGASLYVNNKPQSWVWEKFNFNKATGKSITISNQPSGSYPGNGGAFGLINGARSQKGFNSSEWLAWNKGDVEAIIDLGKTQQISKINIHVLEQRGSWIYNPSGAEIFISTDGENFQKVGSVTQVKPEHSGMGLMGVSFEPANCRYVKIIAKPYGKIAEGQPGAGQNAWLFVDEIEVE